MRTTDVSPPARPPVRPLVEPGGRARGWSLDDRNDVVRRATESGVVRAGAMTGVAG